MPVVPENQRVKWTSTTRKNYRIWWEGRYNNKVKRSWTGIDVHHIIPRKYGGSNSYANTNPYDDNLIPLTKSVHYDFSRWWTNY